MKRKVKPPRKGDLVQIRWIDITCESNGDPKKARPALRVSSGYFLEWAHVKVLGKPRRFLKIQETLEEKPDDIESSGWAAYPAGCVLQLEVVKQRVGK